MKALILAAGFGTRLKPYTDQLPKALFPIAGRPNLDRVIGRLIDAGCDAVAVNTHHLHSEIESFLATRHYPIPVCTRYEPEISGTGGAIKNLQRFWDKRPFLVINGDVVTDIDLKSLYAFHQTHLHPVTLALCDDPEFNSVRIDRNGFVVEFSSGNVASPAGLRTFTGIQVLDPVILDFIPENRFSASIDAYKKMIAADHKIATYERAAFYWKDIGNPKRYMEAVCDTMAPLAFERAFPDHPAKDIQKIRLKGDGSDRAWYRLSTDRVSLVMADHGIRRNASVSEADSFIFIGSHLEKKNVPVPKCYLFDDFSGLVFLEDLGNTHLQDIVRNERDQNLIRALYEEVIDRLVDMSVEGGQDFNRSWAYQSACYDKHLIMEKECRYFVEAFLQGYMGMDICFADLENECSLLAESTMETACRGLMHRDMQSRNVMVKEGRCRFIDFQGARIGPIQYDLASLLIDPYAGLPVPLQHHLLDYAFKKYSEQKAVSRPSFYAGYRFCTVTRNLQMLGAFGFLSRQKGKTWFEQYIPPAVRALRQNLADLDQIGLPGLTEIAEKIGKRM